MQYCRLALTNEKCFGQGPHEMQVISEQFPNDARRNSRQLATAPTQHNKTQDNKSKIFRRAFERGSAYVRACKARTHARTYALPLVPPAPPRPLLPCHLCTDACIIILFILDQPRTRTQVSSNPIGITLTV